MWYDGRMTTTYSDLVPGEEIPPEDQGCPNHIEPDPDETGTDVVHPDQLFVAPYLDEPDRGRW